MESRSDKNLMKLIYGAVAVAFFIVAPATFLFTKDDGGYTGLDILHAQPAGYIAFMVFKFLLALLVGYIAYRVYDKTQEAGKTIVIVLVAIAILGWAFGDGCTAKANNGVTSPGGKPLTEQKE